MVKRRSRPTRMRFPLKECLAGLVLFLLALGLIGRPLARGTVFYQNYWGGTVFVPFAVFILVLIAIAAFKGGDGKK